MKKPRILFITNSTGSRLWRIDPVQKYLENVKGWECIQMESQAYNPDAVLYCDIIVLQMVFDKRIFDLAKKHNKKIVFEADDLIEWVPDDHYAKDDMSLKRTLMVASAFRKADLVTVTNENLKKRYDKYRIGKQKCFIFPNYLDLEYWSKKYNPNPTDIVRIGYAGGVSHVKDLSLIADPLKNILNKTDKIKFINISAGGSSTKDPFKRNMGVADAFSSIPQEKRESSLGASMYAWATMLNSLQLDIGLAPVLDNKFTRCKTPIKYMEYAINNIPTCASRSLYGSVIIDGQNGFLADTKEEWEEKIGILVKDKKKRKEMARAAYEDVISKYDVGRHLHKIYEQYKSLI
jgi:glycosyltransferase involved in cell wall biosynthesis